MSAPTKRKRVIPSTVSERKRSSSSFRHPFSQRILRCLRDSSTGGVGCTETDIERAIPEMSVKDFAGGIDELVTDGYVEFFPASEGSEQPTYFARTNEAAIKYRQLDEPSLAVYRAIKDTGSMGIWTRDLKMETRLPQTQITKILKHLESFTLVKSVKSIIAKNKKLYMLFELQPDKSHYGGPWYTDGDFDSAFFSAVAHEVYLAISNGNSDVPSLRRYIADKNISRIQLGDEDIEVVVQSLLQESRIALANTHDGSIRYKPTRFTLPLTGLTEVPCGRCPVADSCGDCGPITPSTCPYLAEWLDIEDHGQRPKEKTRAERAANVMVKSVRKR